MATPVTLNVYRGQELLRREQFTRGIIKIGRLSSAHLCLDDERVSRIHSVIEVAPDGSMSIIDMGSAEGTFVNGKRVNKGPLHPGDQITLGGLRIVLDLPAGATGQQGGEFAIDDMTGAEPPPPDPQASAPAESRPAVQEPEPAPAAPREEPAAPKSRPAAAKPAAAAPVPARPSPAARQTRRVARLAPMPAPQARSNGAAPAVRVAEPVPARPRVREEPEPHGKEDDEGVELRLLWGETLLDAGIFLMPKDPVRVGSTSSCRFLLPAAGLPSPAFPVLSYEENDYRVLFAPGMTGEVEDRGVRTSLAQIVKTPRATRDDRVEGGFSVGVPATGAVRIDFGSNLHIHATRKRKPKPAVVPWYKTVNYHFLNVLLILLFFMGGFIVAANNFAYDVDTVADEIGMNTSRMAKYIAPPEPPKPTNYEKKLEKRLEQELKGLEPGEMAARHKGEEGQMGKKDAPKTNARSAPKGDPNEKELVKNSGLLQVLGKGRGMNGGLSTIFGHGGLGGDLKGAVGNMFGPVVGDSHGFGGLGIKGTGSGGGGVAETIGIGAIGTKGRGGGLGGGSGYGSGVGNLGHKSDHGPVVTTSDPRVEGSIDPELIRKVVRDHAGQIRACYEQQLVINPKLAGKVSIRWTIRADGSVSELHVEHGDTTLDDPKVHECMMSRIGSWEFPKPKGGGIAIVKYPWILKTAGG